MNTEIRTLEGRGSTMLIKGENDKTYREKYRRHSSRKHIDVLNLQVDPGITIWPGNQKRPQTPIYFILVSRSIYSNL